ncbi:hypothetical protein HPB48_022593 [Haemaphysalis longicornis]|uniref:Inosine/uridine-preferring nucleoside hydrolase domain-containing protein n=1 Tax=Haemaphysalis longicornis TaxID=44386 RepID=A0A9J6GIF4_HAELO|nr:hypothetical protein HPB48_022593 [Haemaphysalis longicornis]
MLAMLRYRTATAILLLAAVPVVQVITVDKRLSPSISLLLDVDTGVDDAMAIILAATLPNVSLKAVTVTYGNTNLSNAYNNTLRVLNVVNRTDVSGRQIFVQLRVFF